MGLGRQDGYYCEQVGDFVRGGEGVGIGGGGAFFNFFNFITNRILV